MKDELNYFKDKQNYKIEEFMTFIYKYDLNDYAGCIYEFGEVNDVVKDELRGNNWVGVKYLLSNIDSINQNYYFLDDYGKFRNIEQKDITNIINNIESNYDFSENSVKYMSKSMLTELQNIQETYEESLMNEDDDCFGGTRDSYANEILDQDLENLFEMTLFQEYKDKNNLLENITTEREEVALDNDIFNQFKDLIEKHINLEECFEIYDGDLDNEI